MRHGRSLSAPPPTSRTPTRPVRLTAAAGPVESTDRRPPRNAPPRSYNFSSFQRRRPATPPTAGDTGPTRPRPTRDGVTSATVRPGQRPGHSRHHFPRPRPRPTLPHSRRESDNHPLRSHFHSRLRSETSLFQTTLSPLLYHSRLNSSTQPSHTHTHPLTLTHWRCVSMRNSLGVVERVA